MPRRILEGRVTSTAQDKTVTVRVERHEKDPMYKKYMKRSQKYVAHDEKNECQVGDWVWIEETAPISKRKTWRVMKQKQVGGATSKTSAA